MRLSAIATGVFGAFLVAAPCAGAAPDDPRATPLTTAGTAGTWMLESEGRAICQLDLGREKISAGSFALTVPLACGDALPSNLVAWAPAPDGVRLVGWDDRSLMGFSRRSDSLLVSDGSSGGNLRLHRGGVKP
jgi:hypothetical protein